MLLYAYKIMLWFLILLTVIFTVAPFIGGSQYHIPSSFFGYILYQLSFIVQYLLVFLLGIGGWIVLHLRKFKSASNNTAIIIQVVSQSLGAVFVSIFFAYAILCVIAIVELNVFSFMLNLNPSFLGVATNPNTIAQILQKITTPPHIIASDQNSQKEVIAIAQATGGNTNFYSQRILASIPFFFVFPVKKTSSTLAYIDTDLIVTAISQKDMQQIAGLVSHLFVSEYFPTRAIKASPHISLMTPGEFRHFREVDSTQKLTKVTEELYSMEDSISTISAKITQDQQNIATNDATQKTSLTQRDKQYNACLSTGTYSNNVFHPTYTKEHCQTILSDWNVTLTQQSDEQDKLTKKLNQDQQLLASYQYYDNFFKAQKTLAAITQGNIPSELGVFEPPNGIKIVTDTSNSHVIGDYFETLVHEYLHYASFVPGKRLENSFFEEGLTEYFARQTIKDNLEIDTNIAYPLQVRIIEEMMKKIAEVDFADIYFSKNEAALEHELDLVYGDNFYENNFVSFESLMYTSDETQALQIANTIMKKIGGPQLKPNDVYSNESNI